MYDILFRRSCLCRGRHLPVLPRFVGKRHVASPQVAAACAIRCQFRRRLWKIVLQLGCRCHGSTENIDGSILAISCEIDGVLSGPRLSAAQARARSRERLCGYLRSLKECVLFFVRRQAPFYPCFVWFSSTKHGIYIRFERGELNKLNSENEG